MLQILYAPLGLRFGLPITWGKRSLGLALYPKKSAEDKEERPWSTLADKKSVNSTTAGNNQVPVLITTALFLKLLNITVCSLSNIFSEKQVYILTIKYCQKQILLHANHRILSNMMYGFFQWLDKPP